MKLTRPTGMQAFTLVWLGQVISLLGSAMTWFAFTIWAWEKTGQVTALAMVSFFAFLPTVLFTPLAGALVDRWNRKWTMMFSDMATALGTLVVLVLYVTGRLEIWHIYAIGLIAGFFTAFQYPAYAAAVTTMLPKEQYTRAQGMLGLVPAISGIVGPMLGAALLGIIGMANIMVIDLITFLAAFGSLLVVHIPQPVATTLGQQSQGSLWQDTLFGFRYIKKRSSLLALTLLFIGGNFFIAIGSTLIAPMVLSRSANSEGTLAIVQSVGALGGIVGGVLLSVWGGPKRRIDGILLGGAGACLLGVVGLGVGQRLFFWALGSFFFTFFEPFVEGGNLSIWQSKVEADVQGRVLAARHLLVQIPYLMGIFIAGPLAEYGVEPLLQQSTVVSSLVGVGTGAGIALVLVLAGSGGFVLFLLGYVFPAVRHAEALLPDQGLPPPQD